MCQVMFLISDCYTLVIYAGQYVRLINCFTILYRNILCIYNIYTIYKYIMYIIHIYYIYIIYIYIYILYIYI